MVVLFKGKVGQHLNALRFQKYNEKIATESTIVAKRLPPTEAATAQHSLRAYYQIQTWMQKSEGMSPLNYGWKESSNRLVPILSNLPPAPLSLLSAIRCGCKSTCNTQRCTCKNAGLCCTEACQNCDESSCANYDSFGKDDDCEDNENYDEDEEEIFGF